MNASRCWTLIALLAVAVVAPRSRGGESLFAGDKGGSRPTSHKLIKKSYPVADLVQTLEQGPAGAGGADLLVRALVCAVNPQSWDSRGGHGTIEYVPEKKVLVICQTASAHGRVAAVLKALSAIQPKQQVPGPISRAVYS